jgi:1-acyl-sn-glycerol-3-phosphate acyltransferase
MAFSHPILRVHGRENLQEGPAVVCCNHTSLSDPVWVILGARQKRVFRTMAKKELFAVPLLRRILPKLGVFPVDRDGSDVGAIKTALRALREREKLLIFPEGTRVKRGQSAQPHGGAAMLAVRTDSPLIPVYLTESKRFLRPLDLVFGAPYHPQIAGKKPTPEELQALTAELMEKIRALGANV